MSLKDFINFEENEGNTLKEDATEGQTYFLLELIGNLRCFTIEIYYLNDSNSQMKFSDGKSNEFDSLLLRSLEIRECEDCFNLFFRFQIMDNLAEAHTKQISYDEIMMGYLTHLTSQNQEIQYYLDFDRIMAQFQFTLSGKKIIENMSNEQINETIARIKEFIHIREQQISKMVEDILKKIDLHWDDVKDIAQEDYQQELNKIEDDIEYDFPQKTERQGLYLRQFNFISLNSEKLSYQFSYNDDQENFYKHSCQDQEEFDQAKELENNDPYRRIINHESHSTNQMLFTNSMLFAVENEHFSLYKKFSFMQEAVYCLYLLQNQIKESQHFKLEKIMSTQELRRTSPVFVLTQCTSEDKNNFKKNYFETFQEMVNDLFFSDSYANAVLQHIDDQFGEYLRNLIYESKKCPTLTSIIKKLECIKRLISDVYHYPN